MYKLDDNQDRADEEFEGYGYSVCLVDAEGEVRGLFIDIELATEVMNALNKNAT